MIHTIGLLNSLGLSVLVVSAGAAANLKMLVDVLEPAELASIVLDKVI